MGWPGPRRRTVPLKLSEEEERPVRVVADAEHDGNLSAAIRALLARASELDRLRAGIREVLDDLHGAPCSFWACPGPDHPAVDMATCNVCHPQIELRALLGDPAPTCTALECDTCGRESPWCDECDAKVIDCEHAPTDQDSALLAEALTARAPQPADQET